MKPFVFVVLLICAALSAAAAESWPDNYTARVEALALLETLNAELLASDSATATLEKWCAAHRMAAPARIVARRIGGVEKEASAETRAHLQVAPQEPVRYRRVQLACGDHILSEADNWYVPARLPEEARVLLETTDTPFGKAIRSLRPSRKTIAARLRWSPLPEGWEMLGEAAAPASGQQLQPPHELLEHRAIVYIGEGAPVSEVDETYTAEMLNFERERR